MTGYGDASAHVDGCHFFVELRSLNNKYFKAVIRLAEEFQGLEAEMEARLRERLIRGTITITARCSEDSASAAYDINVRALSTYIAQLEQLPQVASGKLKLDAAALLGLPGVLQPPANEEERVRRARAAFMPLLDKACDALIAMREREGGTIVADLESHRGLIAARLAEVSERAPAVVAEYQVRLKARIEALLKESQIAVEPGDLVREIAIYAERTDIAEEIKRLSAHLDQFRDLLSGSSNGKPVGRTLDFLAQEMLREANTIASKSPDGAISRAAVEIKGAIDRIKEQSQNVE
ncbi:MAG: YicC family protein [Phycisphaerae bacterium]|nr:YicC family protein [Phycisphaerae bacterium]